MIPSEAGASKKDRQVHRHRSNRQTNKQRYRQHADTDRLTDRQTARQTLFDGKRLRSTPCCQLTLVAELTYALYGKRILLRWTRPSTL